MNRDTRDLINESKNKIRFCVNSTSYTPEDIQVMKDNAVYFLIELSKVLNTVQHVEPLYRLDPNRPQPHVDTVDILIKIDKFQFSHNSIMLFYSNPLVKKFLIGYFRELKVKLVTNGHGTAMCHHLF